MFQKMIDVSCNQLANAAADQDLDTYEVASRGRGANRQFLICDTEGRRLADIRVYELAVQVLPTTPHHGGGPMIDVEPFRQGESGEGMWALANDPASVKRIMTVLVSFYAAARDSMFDDEED